MISPNSTLSDLATHLPGATGVFQDLRLDFCCGGEQTLRAACEVAGVPVAEVLERLEREASPESGHGDQAQWDRFGLEDLVRHVLDTYHTFTRERLTTLPEMARKVIAAHGDRDPAAHAIAARLEELRAELLPHMAKEEAVLFPYAVALERNLERGAAFAPPPFGTVENPLRMMGRDHVQTGETLRALRSAAREFRAPEHACATYRALLTGLEELERDLMLHIHFENAILFPRMAEYEKSAASGQPVSRPRPRPEARVATSMLSLDLGVELDALRSEPGWASKGHNAKTLVKRADSSVVLTLLKAGQRLKEHAVGKSVTLQAVSGRVRVHVGTESVEMRAGGLLALEPHLAHDVEALEESALLITI